MNRAFITFFCCLVFCFETSLGQTSRTPYNKCCGNRIVGGADIDISEVPYHAGLLLGDLYFCGASIISDKFLVTGAHCILFAYQYQRESDDEALFVRMGSNYINKDGVLTTIKKSKCHPKFNMDTYDYDICLLELKEPIKFNKNIQPIKIAEEEPKGGEIGRLAGWGTLWENGKEPKSLQSVLVPVVNYTYCEEAYEEISPITERMLCAGTEGKDSCQGDSGGALSVEGYLVGVISTGFGCGIKNYPGVYTSVAHPEVRQFIKRVARV